MNNQSIQDYDWLVNVILIGDSGVGKTNILLRFIDGQFKTDHMATLGVDFKMKSMSVQDKVLKMQIWDTAGQDRFKTITQSYGRASGIILTYAINDRLSFEHVHNWMKQIQDHASENIVKILVGNKCDSERQVEKIEGSQLASKFEMQFLEVSAKENYQIDDLFEELGKQIKYKIENDSNFASHQKRPGQIKIVQKSVQQDHVLQQDQVGCKC